MYILYAAFQDEAEVSKREATIPVTNMCQGLVKPQDISECTSHDACPAMQTP